MPIKWFSSLITLQRPSAQLLTSLKFGEVRSFMYTPAQFLSEISFKKLSRVSFPRFTVNSVNLNTQNLEFTVQVGH